MIAIESAAARPVHSPDEMLEVTLQVPARFRVQLVFRQERRERFPVQIQEGFCFQFCNRLSQYAKLSGEVRRISGLREALKGCLRSASSRRMFYCVRQNKRIVHYAWVTLSHCRHYAVEANAAVIGPIWSSPEVRGRGLATAAMQLAINELVARGHSTFYIDTSSNNFSCLNVISKCGFGSPMTAYVWR